MNIKNLLVRPSTVLRDIENGFIGLGEVTVKVTAALGQTLADKRRAIRNEYRARTIATGNALADEVNAATSAEALADLETIRVRTDELMAARKSRKAA